MTVLSKVLKFLLGETINKPLISSFIQLLNDFQSALQFSKGVIFNSSSLLLAYDAGDISNAVMKLIDFENAECGEENLVDDYALEGIGNIKESFKQICDASGSLEEIKG